MEKIRILQVVPNMRTAGIENFIMNVYRNIDKSKFQFDFLVHNMEKQEFDDEILKNGGKIYHLTYKDDKNIFKYIKDLNLFFKEHTEYKIVHGEMQSMMPLYLYIAKKHKVPVRIAHSHNANYEKTIKGFILHIFSRFTRFFATDLWACSDLAGKYLFGKRNYTIIHNAIDIDKFAYNEEKRNQIREKEKLNDKFVIGHIGRFDLQKNHEFLLKIFEQIIKTNENSILLCFGVGKRQAYIEQLAETLGIKDKVEFRGTVNNTCDYYQAMDCFVLPSLYEGFPVVGVESQVCGLPCYFSSTITKELYLTENATFIDLNKSPKEWADIICKSLVKKRKSCYIADYDIKKETKKIEKKYIEYLKRGNI